MATTHISTRIFEVAGVRFQLPGLRTVNPPPTWKRLRTSTLLKDYHYPSVRSTDDLRTIQGRY